MEGRGGEGWVEKRKEGRKGKDEEKEVREEMVLERIKGREWKNGGKVGGKDGKQGSGGEEERRELGVVVVVVVRENGGVTCQSAMVVVLHKHFQARQNITTINLTSTTSFIIS